MRPLKIGATTLILLVSVLTVNVFGSAALALDAKADVGVSSLAWYHDAVQYCMDKELMNPADFSDFDTDTNVTRAVAVTILYRMEGSPAMGNGKSGTFIDVPENTGYTDAVEWAAAKGIAMGYKNGGFGPDDEITREQFLVMLYRYAQGKGFDVSVGEETNILSYDDVFDIGEYAISAMQWAAGSGIIMGRTHSTLNPLDTVTCAELAAISMRFDARLVTGAYAELSSIQITGPDGTETLDSDAALPLFSALETCEHRITPYPQHIEAQSSDPLYIITIAYNDGNIDTIYSTETGHAYYRLLSTCENQGDFGYVYTDNPVIFAITGAKSTAFLASQSGLTLTFPAAWWGSLEVDGSDHVVFNLYEPYTKENCENIGGLVWTILTYTTEEYQKYFSEYPLPENLDQTIGAEVTILGWDANNIYLLQQPSDVQFDLEDAVSIASYQAFQAASGEVIYGFLLDNQIDVNNLCDAGKVYRASDYH